MTASRGEAISPEDVLSFWIGGPDDPPLAKQDRWWKKDEAFDREIRERFEATLERGVRGELASWRETPRGRLALVILFDQLSRNMFRGTPRSFAQDALAREVAEQGLAAGDHEVLRPVETTFLLMPFMHDETLEGQDRCIEGLQRLASTCGEAMRAMVDNSLEFARKHREIVARFGRFPHRNEILGRPSTKEEAAFLTQPGSSF